MLLLQTLVMLLFAAVALGWVARRAGLPYPIALVLGGGLLAFVPGLPQLPVDPALILYIVLPPLLYHSALATSWRDFRGNLRAISMLAIGLVAITTLAVGCTIRWLVPGMPWAVAFALGAIVSPTDAGATSAMLSGMRLPRRIVWLTQGESLVNDASGLVLYKFAVAAALTGVFSMTDAAIDFAWLSIGGVALGVAIGWLFVAIHRRLDDTPTEIMLSIVLPYSAYLIADAAGLSAVLAVVAAGLVRGRHAPEAFSPESRMLAQSVWSILAFLINTLVFILIGLQLPSIVGRLDDYSGWALFGLAAAVSGAAIVVRVLWMFPGAWLPRLLSPGIRTREPQPPWQHLLLVGWFGMRGVVSLAAALALPLETIDGTPFPYRDLVIFLVFSLILATLVLQGLTIGPLVRWLRIGGDWRAHEEESQARFRLAEAALEELDREANDRWANEDIIRTVAAEYRARIDTLGPHHMVMVGDDEPLKRTRLAAVRAERRRLIELWRAEAIGDEILHRLERELDFEEARLR
jgi:CPA1 family monovalent cation:H+ antiporter